MDASFDMFKRGGIEPIAYLGAAAWNLREWLREVHEDATLEKVLLYLLPNIRRKVELALIDAGLAGQAADLPSNEDLSAAAIIAFVEGLELAGGSRLQIPRGKPPGQWRTLSRARAEKLAMQLVTKNNDQMYDVENEKDLAKIERADSFLLEKLWDFSEKIMQPEEPAETQAECMVTLLQMAAIVNRDKRTLRRLYDNGKLPSPAVTGGEGKQNEWRWADVRPVLEEEYNRTLPAVFPSDQFVRT